MSRIPPLIARQSGCGAQGGAVTAPQAEPIAPRDRNGLERRNAQGEPQPRATCAPAAFGALRGRGAVVPPGLVRRVAPLGREHIGPAGDHVRAAEAQPAAGALRPLRDEPSLLAA
jgi:hypothetical protein